MEQTTANYDFQKKQKNTSLRHNSKTCDVYIPYDKLIKQ